jgi:hypothetical protein
MGKVARAGAGLGIVALSAALTLLGAEAANAAGESPTAPTAAAGESCWFAVDTGESLCVTTGEDLVAAVAQQKGVRLIIPDGEVVSGVKVDARRDAALVPAGVQTTVVLSTIYDDNGYGGGSYTMSTSSGSCATSAYGFTDLGPIGWYGRVSSFRSYGVCKTALFTGTNYSGSSTGYVTSQTSMGSLNDLAKSWRVSG